jgi:hypothetical protein
MRERVHPVGDRRGPEVARVRESDLTVVGSGAVVEYRRRHARTGKRGREQLQVPRVVAHRQVSVGIWRDSHDIVRSDREVRGRARAQRKVVLPDLAGRVVAPYVQDLGGHGRSRCDERRSREQQHEGATEGASIQGPPSLARRWGLVKVGRDFGLARRSQLVKVGRDFGGSDGSNPRSSPLPSR